jgi:quinone-modifying oxidoreductase subunit QmoB
VDKSTAVYVCKGCGIGDALDIDALKEVATGELSMERCRDHDCLCGEAGRQLIQQDIQEGVNTLVVAACSPRVMTDAFAFDGVLTERVNLREHVVWSHEPNDEDTQMMAADYLRMGVARAGKAAIPEPIDEEIDRTILVVGGGVTGMSAALDAARAGYQVVLVEKEAELGGWMRSFARQIPHASPPSKPRTGSMSTPPPPSAPSRGSRASST